MTTPRDDGVADAVIVGAGLAGTTAAILLARAGWRVVLVEKKPFPRRKVCGECLAASNWALLDELGVAHDFAGRAGPELREVALMRGARTIVAPLPPTDDVRRRWGRALGRDSLDAALLERARAAGAEVLQPWSARSIAGGPGAWRCGLRGPDGAAPEVRATVLIDAHGSWESLPTERARGRPVPRPSDLLAFKANFRDGAHVPGRIGVLALDGGYGGTVVADAGTTVLAGCVRRDRLDALRAAAPGLRAGDVFERWVRDGCRGVGHALEGATRDGSWLASGPLRPGVRTRADGGPFRIGNAGGEAHPILGEGMSMALQSAALLCDGLVAAGPGRLVDAGVSLRVQGAHAVAWRREFAPRLRLAAAFAHAAMRPTSSAALVRLATVWPGLLTRGARLGGKVRLARGLAAGTNTTSDTTTNERAA